MQRTSWIIGGSVVVAVVIVAVALFALSKDETPAERLGDETAGVVVNGAQERAQDRAAQSDLLNAMAAALTYFVDADTYTGWNPNSAPQIEPYLEWSGDGPVEKGMVSINYATGDQVVMSTMSESGQAFCVAYDAASGAGTLFGRADTDGATDTSACAGGW